MGELDGRPKEICDELVLLGDEEFVSVLTASLAARPELAFSVVSFACPSLTFPPLTAISENKYQGTIKSFNDGNNYGFISCNETHELFNCDVFLHGSQYGGQRVGEKVSFAVFLNKDYKPQAFDVESPESQARFKKEKGSGKGSSFESMFKEVAAQFNQSGPRSFPTAAVAQRGAGGGGKGLPSASTPGKGATFGKGFGKASPSSRLSSPYAAAAGKGGVTSTISKPTKGGGKGMNAPFQGVIKSFNEEEGKGFISSPAIKAAIGDEVYVHKTTMQSCGAGVGDTVSFKIHYNTHGRPQAQAPMTLVKQSQSVDGDGQVYFGRLKSFVVKNGYGFIECEETQALYGRDVWVGERVAKAGGCMEVGMDVTFEYHVSHEGNPVCDSIHPA